MATGDASRSGQGRASPGLLGRVRIPLQPAQITQPRQTVLSPRPTGCGNGTNHLSADRRLGSDPARSLTTTPWGYLSQMDNQYCQLWGTKGHKYPRNWLY